MAFFDKVIIRWREQIGESNFHRFTAEITRLFAGWADPDNREALRHYIKYLESSKEWRELRTITAKLDRPKVDLAKFDRGDQLDSILRYRMCINKICGVSARCDKLVNSVKEDLATHFGSLDGCKVIRIFIDVLYEDSHSPDVCSSFAGPFEGDAVRLLVDYIVCHKSGDKPNENSTIWSVRDRDGTPCTKVLPIVQSFGFGKTKLCVHLSAAQPGMLISLRNSHVGRASFSPQDTLVFDYFKLCYERYLDGSRADYITMQGSNYVHAHVTSFLAAYCYELHSLLSQLMSIAGCPFQAEQPAHIIATAATTTEAVHNVAQCWSSVIHALATAIHVKPDFLHDIQLHPFNVLCPRSCIKGQDLANPDHETLAALLCRFSDKDKPIVRMLASPFARSELIERICNRADSLLAEYEPSKSYRGWKQHVSKHLQPALANLERLAPCQLADKVFFHLALDDCMAFQALWPYVCRVWETAKPIRTWLLLIGRDSSIAPMHASESSRLPLSCRPVGGTYQLCKPFRHMPLNVTLTSEGTYKLCKPFRHMPLNITLTPEYVKKVEQEILDGKMTLQNLNRMILRLGRPVRNTVIMSDFDNVIELKALPFGFIKWYQKVPLSQQYAGSNTVVFADIMAKACQRVPLEHPTDSQDKAWPLLPNHQASHPQQALRDYNTFGGLPTPTISSEPPLSMAVAWSFRAGTFLEVTEKWSTAILGLAEANAEFGLDFGNYGEQAYFLVCCMASDLAVNQRYASDLAPIRRNKYESAEVEPSYKSMIGLVQLSEWLEILIGYPSFGKILDKGFQSVSSQCESWCSQRWINFKHVATIDASVDTDSGIETGLLSELWMRHAAVCRGNNRGGWDLLIPVYHCNSWYPSIEGETFLMHRLSYVALQIDGIRPQKKEGPTIIGRSPPISFKNKDASTLELCLDPHGAPKHTYSEDYHRKNRYQTIHRFVVSGHSSSSFPVLKYLSAEAQDKMEALLCPPSVAKDTSGAHTSRRARFCDVGLGVSDKDDVEDDVQLNNMAKAGYVGTLFQGLTIDKSPPEQTY